MQELDLVPKQCLLASENRDAASMLETFHIKICMFFFLNMIRGKVLQRPDPDLFILMLPQPL